LRDETGVELMVRIGNNSGDVVVGHVGGAGAGQAVTVGHAIGMAKRIESIAGPRTVYIGGSTASLIDETFALRSLGAFEIRGAFEPTQLYELVRHCTVTPDGLTQGIPREPFVVLA
jgi:class 3 adenylate cyclase